MRDRLTRRVLPRVVVALSQADWPATSGARVRRFFGRRGRVELFFAFDDPCSAVGVIELARRGSGRDVRLLLKPVVARGIDGDPAVDLKRRYAIVDARRLARRGGLELARTAPVKAADTAFLAEWVSATAQGPALTRFTLEALTEIWFEPSPPPSPPEFAPLWRKHFGHEPPTAGALEENEELMRRRKPYDPPAAWIHGQWFFAHDRLTQIGERLDTLGCTAS